MKRLLAMLGLLCGAGHAAAAADAVTFSRLDWELVCDNTRTCRAVGYNAADGNGPPVSLLLTRAAGPDQPVDAEFRTERLDDMPDKPEGAPLTLAIAGRPAGTLVARRDRPAGALSRAQVDALLPALLAPLPAGVDVLALSGAGGTWRVSGAGATAVLLKMDDVQGRIGTPGALVRKGGKPEASVPPALPAPRVDARPLPSSFVPPAARLSALAAELRKERAGQDCEGLDPTEPLELSARRPSAGKMLVTALCHAGSRSHVYALWSVNAVPPYAPVLVADDITDFSTDKVRSLHAMHECASAEERSWTGRALVLTRAHTSGQCAGRLFPYGAWQLPTFVTDVRLTGARP